MSKKLLHRRLSSKAAGKLFGAFALLNFITLSVVGWVLFQLSGSGWSGKTVTSFLLVAIAVTGFELVLLIRFYLSFSQYCETAEMPLLLMIDDLNRAAADPLTARLDETSPMREAREIAASVNAALGAAAEVHRSYGERSRFVSDASHELRTPIAVIQGWTNMLSRWAKDDPDAAAEAIQSLKEEADGMAKLVEQLLFLSRGDEGRIPLQETECDASGLMRELCEETEMIDSDHVCVLDAPNPVIIKCDAGLIKQALRAIAENAVKYTPQGGKIKFSAYWTGERARLSIEDEGMGIPPDDVPRVFDRFFRTDLSRNRKTGGSGLGLSIAKWIADSHRAEIEVLSRVGAGTRFTIII